MRSCLSLGMGIRLRILRLLVLDMQRLKGHCRKRKAKNSKKMSVVMIPEELLRILSRIKKLWINVFIGKPSLSSRWASVRRHWLVCRRYLKWWVRLRRFKNWRSKQQQEKLNTRKSPRRYSRVCLDEQF